MTDTIIVAVISLIGTLVGTFGGIMASSKLINYRIEQLEHRVDKHNNLIDRMYKVEEDVTIISEKIAVANHRIDDLERLKKC